MFCAQLSCSLASTDAVVVTSLSTFSVCACSSGSTESTWLADLDFGLAVALKGQLFSPSKTTTMPLVDAHTGQRRRSYWPVLYEIQREPAAGFGGDVTPQAMRPLKVTIVLDPVAEGA